MDGDTVKLSLDAARDGYEEGDQVVSPGPIPDGKNTFDLSAEAFAAGCRREPPLPGQRPISHEVLVQETLLRVVDAPGTANL